MTKQAMHKTIKTVFVLIGACKSLYVKGKTKAQELVHRQGRETMVVAEKQQAMATAEYAIVTLAAVGLAGLLILILKSDDVRNMLMGIVTQALSSFSHEQ